MRKLFIAIAIPFCLISIFAPSCPHKRNPEYYYVEGERCFEKKEFKSAYKYFTVALEIKPDYYDAVFRMAVLKVEMDSLKSAIWDFNYAIQLKPSGDIYYQRGKAKWALKDSVGACSDWNDACDLLNNRGCDMIRDHCKR